MVSTHDMEKSFEQWEVWLRENLAPSDLKAAGVRAYLHHLRDLEIFKVSGNKWSVIVSENDSPETSLRDFLLHRLDALSYTDRGFALSGLMGRKAEDFPSEGDGQTNTAKRTSIRFGKNKFSDKVAERSSDLSNLQIVKKVGRQLRGFLDLEQEMVSRLQGTHTSKEDAKQIFNYLLSKSRDKSPPRQWEQLSRKRHR